MVKWREGGEESCQLSLTDLSSHTINFGSVTHFSSKSHILPETLTFKKLATMGGGGSGGREGRGGD